MKKIAIVGSINMDMVSYVDSLPQVGETIFGSDFMFSPGGKGANQAVAARQMGADVSFFGKVGDDPFGGKLITNLLSYGVCCDHIETVTGAVTGTANITVSSGNNYIILNRGANYLVDINYIERKKKVLLDFDLILLQNEIPLETINHLISMLADTKTNIIFDPAPSFGINKNALRNIDYLTPNEKECEDIIGKKIENVNDAYCSIRSLLNVGVKYPIITLGDKGIVYYDGESIFHEKATQIIQKDSTAAGDTFTGAFAAFLTFGHPMYQAISLANIAAGITTTRVGAQNSIPTFDEVISRYELLKKL